MQHTIMDTILLQYIVRERTRDIEHRFAVEGDAWDLMATNTLRYRPAILRAVLVESAQLIVSKPLATDSLGKRFRAVSLTENVLRPSYAPKQLEICALLCANDESPSLKQPLLAKQQ